MRPIPASTQARLADGAVVLRKSFWIDARNRDTGATVSRGWWTDVGTVEIEVPDAENVLRDRVYNGGGDLVGIGDIPLVVGMTAQPVSVDLSIAAPSVAEAIREWDVRRAPVEIHYIILDPSTMRQDAPALRMFVGFVDSVDIPTPSWGSDGTIRLTCAPHTQELLRSNSAKRSDADQRRRNASDRFFEHVAAVPDWTIHWWDED